MFIVFQQYFSQPEVPSTCVPRNRPCLVFESSHTFLTYTDRLCSRLVSGDTVLKFCISSGSHCVWELFDPLLCPPYPTVQWDVSSFVF